MRSGADGGRRTAPGAGRRGRGSGSRMVVSRSSPRDVVGERLEREHQPVAQDVEGHVEDVLRQGVVAAADEGQRPGR